MWWAIVGVMLSADPAFTGEELVEKMLGYVGFSRIKGFEDSEEMVEVYIKKPLLDMVAEMTRDQDSTLYNLLKNIYLIQVRTFSLEKIGERQGELQKKLMEIDRRLKALTERLKKEGWEPIVRAREVRRPRGRKQRLGRGRPGEHSGEWGPEALREAEGDFNIPALDFAGGF
ncbi:MAG TPA: DUF4252 domain-containing protein [Candidatus Latescibacteria bacterium]|nr:DUF4252 domain-containing protein [Candidatus Latescibacterota bacterium]